MTRDAVPEDRYERVLGLPQVTISGVAVIIGAGIFVLLGPATQKAGGLVWLAFVLAAVLSALTAFSYMELASMFPGASAEHEFSRHMYPRSVSATVGTTMSLALVVAAATVALGFARYLNEFLVVDERIAAATLVVVCVALSAFGVERAIWVVVGLGIVEIGTLVVVTNDLRHGGCGRPSVGIRHRPSSAHAGIRAHSSDHRDPRARCRAGSRIACGGHRRIGVRHFRRREQRGDRVAIPRS